MKNLPFSIAPKDDRNLPGVHLGLYDDVIVFDHVEKEENDAEYAEEAEVADVFDSDFDEDEPEADEEGENEPDERRTKKRLIFPGKPSTKKKKKKKVLSKFETSPQDDKTLEQSTPSEHHDVPDDVEGERIIRKSTRTAVIVRQAERDAIRAALQATMKPIKRKKEGEEKRMTQEEMLLEAAQTGYSYLEFVNGASFGSEVLTKATPDPQKALCAVTGLPANYRDPKTGLPYATKEAFKIIRERFTEESSSVNKENGMGLLSDATFGQGFSQKRKRSIIPRNRDTSYFQRLVCFGRVPAVEIEDSE
ncbi:SWR1 complex subunit 2 [Forsythia ovata]|uniref:SWR1 complex subunit 2 n=1 Tax=Forsythia ovata TaxID=205694 RepID=A0ABD1WK29_9LAMI